MFTRHTPHPTPTLIRVLRALSLPNRFDLQEGAGYEFTRV